MLQQTQASRVAERYERFMRRFPTPRTLAQASDREVLTEWQGLGYYRRADLLRRAAEVVVREHGGVPPRCAEALERLPGVGRYTAGAVASIVHGERVPVVDGNVARLLLRLHGRRQPLRDPRALAWCWREADRLVRGSASPAALNEGLMELGATVCTPARPRCRECPLRNCCLSHRRGEESRIPAPPPRCRRRVAFMDLVVVCSRYGVLLERRPERGMWAGLWQPTAIESRRELPIEELARAVEARLSSADTGAGPSDGGTGAAGAGRGSACRAVGCRSGAIFIVARGMAAQVRCPPLLRIGRFVHHTTHREFRVRVFRASVDSRQAASLRLRMTAWSSLNSVPLSSLARRALEMAAEAGGDADAGTE